MANMTEFHNVTGSIMLSPKQKRLQVVIRLL